MNSNVKMVWLMASASVLAVAGAAQAQEVVSAPPQEIVVTAPRVEVIARKKQEDAPVIVNIQAAETIAKYPDYNAAEALGRIPGISLSSDTGEGRFVNIRGIDANLNGATYGGVVLLNTLPSITAGSGAGRAVEFDTIPTGAIDGIIVYKTLSPDREAEGLGGQIELTPRSSKNLSKPFVEGELGWGYENLHDHTGPFTAGIAAGARFGFGDHGLIVQGDGQEQPVRAGWISNPTPFSFVITGSRKDDRRGVDDTEPSYANDGATCGFTAAGTCDHVLGRVDFRRYDYHRRRFGYGFNFDFTPNEDHNYYVRLDVAGYKERSHKNHFYAQFDGSPSAPDAQGYVVDGFQPQVDLIDLDETHRNTVFAIGGEDRFSKLVIDYRAAYSRATYLENYYDEARFFGQDIYFGRYNDTKDPKRFSYQLFKDAALTVPFVSTDATQYGAPNGRTALTAFFETNVDEEYSYVANARYPLNLFGYAGELKGGLSARLRDKVVNDFGGFGAASLNLSAISPSVGPGNNYYNGWFPPAPYADIYKADALVRANTTLKPSLGQDFNDNENVYAGYLMYTTQVGKLGVLTGVRVEGTDAKYGNFLTTTVFDPTDPTHTNTISTVSSITRNNSYINAFPTVQLKYALAPNMQVRATYSTGIARPGFTQAGGNAGVDFTSGTLRPQATAGNPNLKPTTGNNFDLDYEYYLSNGGIIQIGLFDKEFDNYIFKSTRVNVLDKIFDPQGLTPMPGDFITFINESAYARGLEIAYHQKFTDLPVWLGQMGLGGAPDWLRGFGVDGNITWVDSRFREYSAAVSGTGKDEFGPLPGTSHVTWNLAAFYEDRGLALRLSAEYVGASLFGLNGDRTLDVIQDKKLNLDFSSSYQFTRNLNGYFQVKNLLDTPLRYNDGDHTRTQQIEYYGQTYEAGIRFKF